MKNLMLLVFAHLFFYNTSFSQKVLNEATLTYNISIQSSEDKTALSKSLKEASLILYIKGNLSRSDMSSALGTESNIYDLRGGKGAILKEYSGQKLMITLKKENWLQKNLYFQNMQFSIDNKEENIGGFKCRKATGTSESGKSLVVYFTPDIALSNNSYNNAFPNLPGIPVQYEINSGKFTFQYILSKINEDPVPSLKFELPKSGFRIMTYEENQQLKKEGK